MEGSHLEHSGLTVENVTRSALANIILEKHKGQLDAMVAEFESNKASIKTLLPEVESLRTSRDALNGAVQELKKKRQGLHQDAQKMRQELFTLLEQANELEKTARDLEMYKKHMSDIDWKLQTQAITIEAERRLLGEIKTTLSRVSEAAASQEKMVGVKGRVQELSGTIGGKFDQTQAVHEEMLKHVLEAEGIHKTFLDKQKVLKDTQFRNDWLEHRIQSHLESIKYWKEQLPRFQEEERTSGPEGRSNETEPAAEAPRTEAPLPEGGAPQDAQNGGGKDAPAEPAPPAPEPAPEPNAEPAPSPEPQTGPQDPTTDGGAPQ